jgi:hypothetical protein
MMSEFSKVLLRVVYLSPNVDDDIKRLAKASKQSYSTMFNRLLSLGMKSGQQSVR